MFTINYNLVGTYYSIPHQSICYLCAVRIYYASQTRLRKVSLKITYELF